MKKIKTLFLLIALLASFSFGDVWTGDDSKPESTQMVDGKKFYVITTPEELAWIAKQVNAGNNSINAVLANDIVFGEDTASVTGFVWTPIGKDTKNAFKGILDGAGYSIYGVYTDSIEYAGLVGVLGSAGVVKNVNMKRDSINSSIRGKNDAYAGGIVGYNDGGMVSGCTNGGSVNGDDYTGGVVGRNGGTVSGCTNAGRVNGKEYTGGVVGGNDGTVSGCTNAGRVNGKEYTGGVVGRNGGTVSDCTNEGSVTASDTSKYSYAGGIIGYNRGSEALVKNSYSRTDTLAFMGDGEANKYGEAYRGGVAGVNADSAQIINCYYDSEKLPGVSAIGSDSATATDVSGMTTAEMQSDQFVLILNTTNGSEKNSGLWSRDGGYPILVKAAKPGGSIALHVAAQPRFNLQVQNRTIWVQNARMGESFAVFDVQGHVLRRGVVNSTEQSITLQNAGAYIVRVGTETMRVRVK